MRKEPMVAGPMPNADLAGSEDALGNKAMAAGQGPASEDQNKQAERRGGEDRAKVL